MYPGAPRGFGGRDMGLYVGPLGVGEVGLICFSHARYLTEPPYQNPFSDSFSRLDFSDLGAKGVGYELVTSPPKER